MKGEDVEEFLEEEEVLDFLGIMCFKKFKKYFKVVVKVKFLFWFIIFDEEVDFDEGFFGLGRKLFL